MFPATISYRLAAIFIAAFLCSTRHYFLHYKFCFYRPCPADQACSGKANEIPADQGLYPEVVIIQLNHMININISYCFNVTALQIPSLNSVNYIYISID